MDDRRTSFQHGGSGSARRLLFRHSSRRAGLVALLFATAAVSPIAVGIGLAQRPAPREGAPLRSQAAAAAIAGEYIVVFGQGDRAAVAADAAGARIAVAQSRAAEETVKRLGGTVRFTYRSALIGFSARLTPAALEAVRRMPGVAWIEPDQKVSLDVVQQNPPTGLDRTSERVGLDQRYTYSTMGTNVHAYIIDTGIFGQTEFGTRLSPIEFTSVAPDAVDCNGHGTHVAGTVGSATYGIAKDVTLHRVRVLDCGGSGTWSGVIAGVDWVTNQRNANPTQPAVANMSLGGGLSSAVNAAVANSIAAGVTYVVAAGNNIGADACNASPASVPGAITVGAIDPTNDQLANFSNLGPCVDLFAPGVNIKSTWLASGTNTISGTSMASPHAAGVAALVLGVTPTATPALVWSTIDNAASTPGTHPSYTWSGIGGLAPGAAVNKLLHWGSVPSDGFMDGDPHLVTVDGVRYDFQGAGEYVYLRDPGGAEIQVRHSPVATASMPGFADPYDGLATCVSLNTAVAARVGTHRVTLQPGLSGVPDPSGLQMRIDGAVTPLTAAGTNLGAGTVKLSGGGMAISFADGSALLAVPAWWPAQNMWYLNVDVLRTTAAAGLLGPIAPGSWLPALPGGASVGPMPGGPMPAALNQRYAVLYGQYGNAWRVTPSTSLFDYAPGTSTANFTDRNWPRRSGGCLLPHRPQRPAAPIDRREAAAACAVVENKRRREDCVFDVAVTGERGFARTYAISEQLRSRFQEVHIADGPATQDREKR